MTATDPDGQLSEELAAEILGAARRMAAEIPGAWPLGAGQRRVLEAGMNLGMAAAMTVLLARGWLPDAGDVDARARVAERAELARAEAALGRVGGVAGQWSSFCLCPQAARLLDELRQALGCP